MTNVPPEQEEEELVVARPPPRPEKTLEELEKEETDLISKARAMLKKAMEHPSNKFGQVFADDDDDDGGIDYGTDTEEDGARDEAAGNGSSKGKRYKRSYQAPPGSTLGEYLAAVLSSDPLNHNSQSIWKQVQGKQYNPK